MKKTIYISLISSLPLMFSGCRSGEPPMVNLGIDDKYSIYRMSPLILHPEYPGEGYVWTMKDCTGVDSVISRERDLYFVRKDVGEYTIKLQIIDRDNPVEHQVNIKVWEEDVAYSAYISTVHEYHPAPGQFINELPKYEDGDNAESMRRKAEESISGKNDVMISLGNYGGYVIFSFDHTVVNVPGQYDFKIHGNAFYASSNPNPSVTDAGGSSEPGIVMVSQDMNGNGIPDDPWYELAGSEYHSPATLHGYSVSYYRTPQGHIPTPGLTASITDTSYILYKGSDGVDGYVEKNTFHTQDYWPKWLNDDIMTFSGSRLAPNAVDESHQGSYYVLYAYPWGYVDNHPNEKGDLSSFNIEWAVNASGKRVHLEGIDFIKVYTGVNQQCGWLGETSTEVCRAEDLHILEQ